jgi:hypothetical protein
MGEEIHPLAGVFFAGPCLSPCCSERSGLGGCRGLAHCYTCPHPYSNDRPYPDSHTAFYAFTDAALSFAAFPANPHFHAGGTWIRARTGCPSDPERSNDPDSRPPFVFFAYLPAVYPDRGFAGNCRLLLDKVAHPPSAGFLAQ